MINLPLVLACLWLIAKAVPTTAGASTERKVDVIGGLLCVLGLGGSVFALIEQPRLGWSSLAVTGSLVGGVTMFAAFLFYESRASDPMLRLDLFRSRNFAVGNVETLVLYGGLSALFFFLVLYLQQVAGYWPLKSGLALLPESLVMFALSSRFGAMADRLGPRVFMGAGPLVAGAGMLMLLSVGVHVDYLTEVLPGVLTFSLGLSITVAPLTAAILGGVDEDEAGIGSAVNNAVARVGGLIATVTIGALMAAQFSASLDRRLAGEPLTPRGRAAVSEAKQLTLGRPAVAGLPRREAAAITVASGESSLRAFRVGIGVASALVILGGLVGAAGIRDPRRVVRGEQCPGGQLAGAPLDAPGCTPRNRVGRVAPLRLHRERERRGQACAATRRTVDPEPPSERPVCHPHEAVAVRVRASAPIVDDLDVEGAVCDRRSDDGPPGVRVLRDVRECLGHDEVGAGFDVGRDALGCDVELDR